MSAVDLERLLANARRTLLAERNKSGHWVGALSSSALSTATGIVALHCVDATGNSDSISKGRGWLAANQNDDGGWGDTTVSHSNISTTLLCWSALTLLDPGDSKAAIEKARKWIRGYVGSEEPDAIVPVVIKRYGKDRTFAVPILMMCAICGTLGEKGAAWKRVLALPFELSVFPQRLFALLRLPVVSYALPALIAIGYARFRNAPPWFPLNLAREWAWPRASGLLKRIQPEGGGFLEATPLTSFVAMALAASGEAAHPVAVNAARFIRNSMRTDGSWPIDENLSTWCTTLATKALLRERFHSDFDVAALAAVREWLVRQQYRIRHPYTNAAPGGWAWTDLSGGVPDADDTPGALIALKAMGAEANEAIEEGIGWLLDLQNGDGGMPTFCRGWGRFPFDRSSADITAHALRAFQCWKGDMGVGLRDRIEKSISRGLAFLMREQESSGAWKPLWFGNQHAPEETNRVYGTSMVMQSLELMKGNAAAEEMHRRGAAWLIAQQNEGGGWGGERGCPSSIEETALALDALALVGNSDTLERGVAYIEKATSSGNRFEPAPIGFYFAKLWYYEKLYPMVWTVSALERVASRISP